MKLSKGIVLPTTVCCAVILRQDIPTTELPNAWPEILLCSPLDSGITLCPQDTVTAVNFKRRSTGTSSKWHPRYLDSRGGISCAVLRSHFFFSFFFFPQHLRHFSCCLKVIRMLVCVKVRHSYIRSLVRMKSWKLSEQSLLWGWGCEVPTKIHFALSVLCSSLPLPAKTPHSLCCSVCALNTAHSLI